MSTRKSVGFFLFIRVSIKRKSACAYACMGRSLLILTPQRELSIAIEWDRAPSPKIKNKTRYHVANSQAQPGLL